MFPTHQAYVYFSQLMRVANICAAEFGIYLLDSFAFKLENAVCTLVAMKCEYSLRWPLERSVLGTFLQPMVPCSKRLYESDENLRLS